MLSFLGLEGPGVDLENVAVACHQHGHADALEALDRVVCQPNGVGFKDFCQTSKAYCCSDDQSNL